MAGHFVYKRICGVCLKEIEKLFACWLIEMKHKYLNLNIFRNLRFNLDRVGFCMSSLCAVHCICLPILIVIMPFLAGTWLVNRELEWVFAICSVLFAIGCSAFSSRLHKKYWLPIIAFFGGIILLGAHYTAPDICCSEDLSWPHFMGTALGGSLLASTHFINISLSKCNQQDSCKIDQQDSSSCSCENK